MSKKAGGAKNIIYPPNCSEIKESMSKDEVIKRLKELYVKFQEFDQDDANNEKYKPLANYLASRFFFDHGDREVRMYTACILADAMRIFAPNAPFSQMQLKDVLRFFIKQLAELSHLNSPVFRHAFYLLDVITSTQVFCAFVQFEEHCTSLFCEVFECLFNAVHKDHAPNVKTLVIDLCVTLLQEAPTITCEILECILSRLVEPSKSSNPVAFKLVLDIILKANDCLEPAMSEFFRTAMLSGSSGDSSLSKDAYAILFELCVGSPDVVHNVLSVFLREALELPLEALRLAAVRFAGQLFARSSGVGALFASKYAQLWTAYLGRSKDASLTIRTCWIKQSVCILESLTLGSDDEREIHKVIYDRLITRATDADAQIRLAVIESVVTLSRFDFSRVPDELLRKVEELTRDKHARTRNGAILALGRIYRRVCVPLPTDKKTTAATISIKSSDMDNFDADDNLNEKFAQDVFSDEQKNRICWIRNKILHLYAASSLLEDRALVERVLYACLVPVQSLDLDRRLEELVSLYTSLDELATACFDQLIRFQSQLREVVHRWASYALDSAAGQSNSSSSSGSQLAILSRMLPTDSCPPDALAQLDRMLTSNRFLAERLKTATDCRCSSTKATELAMDIVKVVSNESKQKSSSLLAAVKCILERTLPLLVSGSSLVGLLRIVLQLNAKPGEAKSVVPALRLCCLVASVFKNACLQVDPALVGETTDPDHFKYVLDHFVSLFDGLSSPDALAVVAQTLPYLITSPNCFQNQAPQFYLTVHVLQTSLSHLALRAHVALAKQATKCLIHVLPSSEYVRVISPIVNARVLQINGTFKKIKAFEESTASTTAECTPEDGTPLVSSEDDLLSISAFYSLARVATYLPKSFFNDMRALVVDTNTWLNSIFNKDASVHTNLRIAALKFLARWLSSLRQDQPISGPLLKRVCECITAHLRLLSDVNDLNSEENKDVVAIGLAATSSLLRLLRSHELLFMSLPSITVVSLALLMASMDVKSLRSTFRPIMVKVQRLIVAHTLPPITLSLLACTLVSNDKELRTTMRQMIDKLVSAWRLQAQHQSTMSMESSPETATDTRVMPLHSLPDSLLPGLIVLLSFIATNNINQLEACRSALSIVFELMTSRSTGDAAGGTSRTASEHLPICRGLVNKVKSLSSSVNSSYVPPDFTQSWSDNSLSAIINVALAEIPSEKGKAAHEDVFSVDIDSKQFFSIIGPLCEIFQGDVLAATRGKQLVDSGSSSLSGTVATNAPLAESGKANVQQKPLVTSEVEPSPLSDDFSSLVSTPVLHTHPHPHPHLPTSKNKGTANAEEVKASKATANAGQPVNKLETSPEEKTEPSKSKASRGKKRKATAQKAAEQQESSYSDDAEQSTTEPVNTRRAKRKTTSPAPVATKPATRRRSPRAK